VAVRRIHHADLAAGFGRVMLPGALDRKYPHAATEWSWQFVFPAGRICRDERFGPPTRYHLHESVVQRAVTEAGRKVGLAKRVGHSHRPGTARARRRQHDDGLHARLESRRVGSEESHGPLVAVFTRGSFAMKHTDRRACPHVYLRLLAMIQASAGNPALHLGPNRVLICAPSAG
jgi:hypothetical protein